MNISHACVNICVLGSQLLFTAIKRMMGFTFMTDRQVFF